ncbi:MAG: sulfotransferase [Pirellulales bacterium]
MRKFNKLFVISLPRCATVSTCQALGLLGLRIAHLGKIHGELGDEHHHPARLQQMMNQIRAGAFRFELLELCDGLADYPACCFSVVEQLILAYPNSLFINVQRKNSVAQWLQSVESQFVGLELLQESAEKCPEHQQFVEVMMQFRELTFGSQRFDAGLYERAYFNYQDSIGRLFGDSDRLLTFNDLTQLSHEGFSKLCRFLEVENTGLGEFPCSNAHSSRPRQAFLDALREGKIRSQTGIV